MPQNLVSNVPNQLRPTFSFLENLGFVGPHSITPHSEPFWSSISNSHFHILNSITHIFTLFTHTYFKKLQITILKLLYQTLPQFLQSLGFSYEEVVSTVIRSPGLLTFSITNNLLPKVRYFLEEMKGDIVDLKMFPQYFSFS